MIKVKDTMTIIEIRQNDFFSQLDLAPITLNRYKSSLNSKLLKEIIFKYDNNVRSLFEITDIKLLWAIYQQVNIHPKNIKNHRNISCALMKYIRFLNNGKKYGKRIDYKKSKPKRNHNTSLQPTNRDNT